MYILIIVFALILILLVFFNEIAHRYVKKNRQELFDKTKPLSESCANTGYKLLREKKIYLSYIDELGLNQVYKCSNSIVSNAENNITKYLIKYTNIENDMDSIEKVDFCVSWLQLYYQTIADMKKLTTLIKPELPMFVRIMVTKSVLPYIVCDVAYKLKSYETPEFVFSYTSPAGKSSSSLSVPITINVLRDIKAELYAKVNRTGYSKAQRSAMTNDLREAIKRRDNYTCCICGNSVYNEPNLLLEVDHIIPIAKGGRTEAGNLQTLCWKCNRSKSDRLYL